jgi:hypothetical protein
MFGGIYEYYFGYGSAYRLRSYILLSADNTYEDLQTESPWGYWAIQNGVYDPASETMSHTVLFVEVGFSRNVVLTKE